MEGGAQFGEEALLGRRYKQSALALALCDIFVLRNVDFCDIMEGHAQHLKQLEALMGEDTQARPASL